MGREAHTVAADTESTARHPTSRWRITQRYVALPRTEPQAFIAAETERQSCCAGSDERQHPDSDHRCIAMLDRLAAIAMTALIAACSAPSPPTEVRYASYDDCVLGKLGRGQSKVASEALIAACKRKYGAPKVSATEATGDSWRESAPILKGAPPKEIELPDGTIAQFPANMPDKDIERVLRAQFPPSKQSDEPGPWNDYASERKPWDESDQAETFHGHGCTDDCSGHEAGYKWAEEKGITDPDDCGGKSRSFIEGCHAWAEDQD